MIASKFFFHIYFLLILTCVPYIFTSTLEFNFPVCSETHVKAEYALQDPTLCKTHILHLTRQCNVNVLKQEHYIYNIPAISCQQVSTTTTSTFYFLERKPTLRQQTTRSYPHSWNALGGAELFLLQTLES